MPNEFLKYGGDIIIKSLSDLFTCISDFEMIPDDWCKGIIKPLHKSGIWYVIDTGALPIFRLFKVFVIDSLVKTIENILSP
jgi:hypothetical protein